MQKAKTPTHTGITSMCISTLFKCVQKGRQLEYALLERRIEHGT
jgi:hypothetical protein